MPNHRVSRGRDETAKAGPATKRRRQGGQTLVEFALVAFAFTFNAVLAAQYASRDAALVAAEAGNQAGADCVILQTVEGDMGAPANPGDLVSVEVYQSSASGVQIGAPTVYARGGSL